MATTALVDKSSINLGRKVIAALSREGIPVTIGLWAYSSQSEEWQLTIATPLVDELGPLAAYGRVQKALQRTGVENEFPLRRIFLRSPKDRVLRLLQRESRLWGREDYRLVNASIEGSFIEDAYLYAGFIQIIQRQRKTTPPIYDMFYAPYDGPAGMAPSPKTFEGSERLRYFLRNILHMSEEIVESAFRNLDERGSVTVPNLALKHKDVKRLGLA
ncbi:MAG: hypothetical protein ABSG02_02710 [Terriglobales bacterium]|jgi:hypothetical protein